jgi:cytoskeletal protein RodZ
MKEIGEYLKNRRIELGISLDEAEQYLKIRKKYLIGIEEGNENILPGRTYFIGYLRNYANYLDADQEYITKLLEGEREEEKPAEEKTIEERQIEEKPKSKEQVSKRKSIGKYFYPEKRKYRPKREKRNINYLPFVKIIVIILLLGGIIFVVNQFLNRIKEPSVPISQNGNEVIENINPEEKSIEEELTQMAEENIEKDEIELIPPDEFLEPLPDYKPIKILAQEPAWIKVIHEGKVLYEDFLLSTEDIALKVLGQISIITASPDDIRVIYDDKEIEAQPSDDYRLARYQIIASNENN